MWCVGSREVKMFEEWEVEGVWKMGSGSGEIFKASQRFNAAAKSSTD